MRQQHLKYLACPACRADLTLIEVTSQNEISIETGTLCCVKCSQTYPIIRHIPRFVPLENYASGFGLEWTKHARTQYDSYSGASISETRLFAETRWPRQLTGEVILEVGSGSGRFTEHLITTGAMVVSTDLSYAVEVNYNSNGSRANALIVQSDIYKMPFREYAYDKLLCIGVLQHTPDVKRSFMSLPPYLKSGGSLVVDIYRKQHGLREGLRPRNWARAITRKVEPEKLYHWCERYITLMWPRTRFLHKIPRGRRIIWALLIADYTGRYDLSDQILREWAILDTFDILAPAYDQPQHLETIQAWFAEAKLCNVDVHYGYNGIEGRGVKP
ncbi:MAG: methyltransferase domain-containing protein [Chloroflexi bacterium]|nr:methyltransferase domain-containing protein [Chloroflexota bacterium]